MRNPSFAERFRIVSTDPQATAARKATSVGSERPPALCISVLMYPCRQICLAYGKKLRGGFAAAAKDDG